MYSDFEIDYIRFNHNAHTSDLLCMLRIIKNYELRVIWILRKYQHSNGLFNNIWKTFLLSFKRKYGIEIVCKHIGSGLRLIHPYGITVNSHAQLGKNVTLYKGVTIGLIENGDKAGNPTIEDNVTIYANATVCGNIHIGSNSVIASNAFVNFDVPPNSVVIGNPGIIHHKDDEKRNSLLKNNIERR